MQPKLQEQRGQRSKSCHATFTVFHHLHRVAQHATEKKMLSLNWQNNIRFDCPCTYGLVELKRRAKCTFPSNFVVCSWLYNPLFWLVSLSVSQSENQSVLAFLGVFCCSWPNVWVCMFYKWPCPSKRNFGCRVSGIIFHTRGMWWSKKLLLSFMILFFLFFVFVSHRQPLNDPLFIIQKSLVFL